jgi:bifunctional DNA-binding transcriptional regulator/antitoxin component of YhaV-PrlF toxin-antitoxin module
MNLIHTKLRNRLGIEKSDKLIYIYMNQQVLARNRSIYIGDPIEKTQEEQLELEDSLIKILDHKDSSNSNNE